MDNSGAVTAVPETQASSRSTPAAGAPDGEHHLSSRVIAGRILFVAVPVAVWFAPLPVETAAKHAFAVGLFMIIGWIFDAMPHAVTGLIGCYLFWALGVARFEAAFSGFASDIPWFFFGALLFGMMATETGLARRVAALLLIRVGNSFSNILLGMILLSFMLTLLVPSGTACVVIMASIAIGLLQAYGYGHGSNIARAMFITLTYTAGLFDKMVIAGPASILGRGLIMKTANVEIYWSQWFLAYLPLSLITILAAWRIVLWLYPPEQKTLSGGKEYLTEQLRQMGPWTGAEKHALFLMLATIALWMTDSFHHISPAMIGLGAGFVAILPKLGVLEFDCVKRVNLMAVFFVATAGSLGQVLMQTKALDVLTKVIFAWMAPLLHGKYLLVLVPYWTAFAYHIFLGNEISMLATSVPPLVNFAIAHGLNPKALGMVWSFAGGGKIFVYQSGVMIVGYSYGYFSTRDLLRVGGLLTIVESVLLMLIVPHYWPLIGLGR